MGKNTLKYITDSILFISLSATAVLGFLMEFAIPRGQGHGSNVFLGLDRHEWGDMHFFLALIFLTALVAHLTMNRTWIVQFTRKYFQEHTPKIFWSFAAPISIRLGFSTIQ